jgi:hypothetical protein
MARNHNQVNVNLANNQSSVAGGWPELHFRDRLVTVASLRCCGEPYEVGRTSHCGGKCSEKVFIEQLDRNFCAKYGSSEAYK